MQEIYRIELDDFDFGPAHDQAEEQPGILASQIVRQHSPGGDLARRQSPITFQKALGS